MRPMEMFSPVEMRRSSTTAVISSVGATSGAAEARASSASLSAVSMKFSFFAVKSVSALSSTIAAASPSMAIADPPFAGGAVDLGLHLALELLAQESSAVDVAAGFGEGFLALHHRQARAVAQGHHVFGADLGHLRSLRREAVGVSGVAGVRVRLC
jgi:hypothetical protein